MKYFKHIFTFLFILSIFVGVLHELSPEHQHDESCEICLVAHSPVLLNESLVLSSVYTEYEEFSASFNAVSYEVSIFLKSRSPPLS